MKRTLFTVFLIAIFLFMPNLAQRPPSAQAAKEQITRSQAAVASPRYTVTDLGTLGGASEAFVISNNGKVAGRYATGVSTYQAFLWEDGVMQGLGTLGGDSSEGYGVNDDGQVAGISKLGNGYTAAFRWDNGAMQNLGTLGGQSSGAYAINNSGQVAGWTLTGGYEMHAFLWNGGMMDLGVLSGGNASFAYAISDSGQVAGWGKVGTYPDIDERAFRWNGSMQDLGTLGWAHSSARGINDNGDVVGRLTNEDNNDWHAFAAIGGGMQDLGGTLSTGYDINNAGLVVGESGGQAILWENGQMKNLNSEIPTGSGWTLTSARGINNRGQIVGKGTFNGQTRAFMLKPNAYHWTNPSGGLWHLTTNWDPAGDPGAGDTVIFALNGQYSVDVGTLVSSPSSLAANQFSIDRMVVSSTNFVYFDNMDLNMVYDSPEEPSLEVNDGGTAAFNTGAATFSHAIIGRAPPANPSNPPIARLQVLGSGTSLAGTGRLTIGDEGAGNLFVTAGGHLISAESRLGGVLATGAGTADVGGDGSLWDTGNIAVGYGISGTLTIKYGGRVNSEDAYVSYGVLSNLSEVTVDGISASTSQPAMWALQGNLFVGQTEVGFVEVLNGGSLYVGQNAYIKNGGLKVDGRPPNGVPSQFDVLGSVFVGGPGSDNLLALKNTARGGIEGDLIIGKDGKGAAILWGGGHLAYPTQLYVVDPQAGLCAIGQEYDGGVDLDSGGMLRCRNIQLGKVGASGAGTLSVDGGMVYALDVLTVGADGGGSGLVTMENNALVMTNGTYITANGVISGTGTLVAGFFGLKNDGVLSPGITVPAPSVSPNIPYIQAALPTMTITGNLTSGSSGRLVIPLSGGGAGQYGSLAVEGAAVLDGVLALDFRNGYAPKQGDIFTFLTATGAVTGSFDSVAINGLMPGFEYDLKIVNGQVVLEALNDGIPLRMVFLPLVRR